MKAFWSFFKLSFLGLLINSVNIGRNKKKAASGIAALLFLGGLMAFISGTLSFSMAAGFAALGALPIMILFMILIAVLLPTFLTAFSGQGIIFSTKDIDIVLSLPISTFSVMLARLMAVYLECLLIIEVVLAPAGVAYILYGGEGGLPFVLRLMLLGVFIAFIPTIFSVIIGAFYALVLGRLRYKNLITILINFVFLGIFFWFYYNSLGAFMLKNALLLFTPQLLYNKITSALPPLEWILRAAYGELSMFLLIIAICVIPFVILSWLFSKVYKQALTSLASFTLKSNYKLKHLKAGSSFSALFKKEARRFFGSPALMMNSGIGPIMIFIFTGIAVVNSKAALEIFSNTQGMESLSIQQFLPPFILLAINFMLSTVMSSAVSISLEGKNLWIIKEAPVTTGRIFLAKAGFNFIVGAITILISLPIISYVMRFSLVEFICMLVLSLLFCTYSSGVGLFINLNFPRMDAKNEMMVVKNSSSVILSMLTNTAILGVLAGLYVVLHKNGIGFLIFSVMAAGFLILCTILVITLLNTKGRKLFAAL